MTEPEIQDLLSYKYAGNCKYKVSNVYIFGYESDYFVLKHNGYSYEFEIKISRSDYFADFKKGRHEAYRNNSYKPNRFFYVVPDNLIAIHEVPEFAGLIYVKEGRRHYLEIVKTAPFLHKEKLDYSKKLCQKFYDRWINEKIKNRNLELDIKYLREISKKSHKSLACVAELRYKYNNYF